MGFLSMDKQMAIISYVGSLGSPGPELNNLKNFCSLNPGTPLPDPAPRDLNCLHYLNYWGRELLVYIIYLI